MTKRPKYQITAEHIEELIAHREEHKRLRDEVGLVGVDGSSIQTCVDVLERLPGNPNIEVRPEFPDNPIWATKQYKGTEFLVLLGVKEALEHWYLMPEEAEEVREAISNTCPSSITRTL